MTNKRIQLYENFPDIGETKYVVPNPSFKEMYGNDDYGFFSFTKNTSFMDVSNWDKNFEFKFLHGKSELNRDPMSTFKRSYVHNGLDWESLGSSGKYFWDNGSGANFGKNHSPTKKIAYYMGMEINRDNSHKVSSGSWTNGRVMPVRGCVGWSGYVEVDTEYTGNRKGRNMTFMGIYVVLCNSSQDIRIAEFVATTHTVAKDRTTSYNGQVSPVGDGESSSPYLVSSNIKDPYCGDDRGELHLNHGSDLRGSYCSDEDFRTPKDSRVHMTYCFTKQTQQKIYNEKWVPIGMMFYVGMKDDNAPATTRCDIKLKRNKLLYRPQNISVNTIARPGSWGDPTNPHHYTEIRDYNTDTLSHKSLMVCPELVPLKDYWSAINSNKRKIAAINF